MSLSIYEIVLADIKTAMKSREKDKLECLRLIANEVKMHAINNKLALPASNSISIDIVESAIAKSAGKIAALP